MIAAYLFILIAAALPPMIFWAFAFWLFPRSIAFRFLAIAIAFVALFVWFPELLLGYMLLIIPLLSLGVIGLFEWLLARHRKVA